MQTKNNFTYLRLKSIYDPQIFLLFKYSSLYINIQQYLYHISKSSIDTFNVL